MIEVLRFLEDSLAQGTPAAMVVLTESEAHTPGRSGAIMAVLQNGAACGTVGGGTLEFELTKLAQDALADSKGREFALDLKKEYGMLCGGSVKGYITVLNAGDRLVLFGGGHVAQVVAKVARTAGFFVTVIEDRPEFQEFFAPQVQYQLMNPAEAAEKLSLGAGDYCLIVTRGHEYDQIVLESLLPRTLAYLGMIGSRKKVAALFANLQEKGVSPERLEQVYSPVGLNIDNGSLGEIAISIVAEILAVKNKKMLEHRRETQNKWRKL